MCGVIGVHLKNVTKQDLETITKVFVETQIRGKHATGITYVREGKLTTIKESIPSAEFVEKYPLEQFINEDGGLYLIGHIRYSTSDLRYHQPFDDKLISIVHNGVITQEPTEDWLYETETENDSELILRSFEAKKHPLDFFKEKSMSVCCIGVDKRLFCFRNHERPLWYSELDNGVVFTSTSDIAFRSGLNSPIKCDMFVEYNQYYHNDEVTKNDKITQHQFHDLQ